MSNNRGKRKPYPHSKQRPMRDLTALTTTIDIIDDLVNVPRDEYESLIYKAAMLDFIRVAFKGFGKYAIADLIAALFTTNKKEDK